jgi:MYXO-CTERM domain-containing protein
VSNADGAGPSTPAEIEADIVRQREELADTVAALHAKLDVPARARARAAVLRQCATTPEGRPRPAVLAGAAGVLALAGGLLVWRRRS